jgi:folate-binding protein YgfZ
MERLHDRALIRLSPTEAGEDVRGFLQGLVTSDVRTVAPGAPVWAGLLTPQGKALFDFLIWADGESLLLDCEAAQAAGLVRRLSLYRLRRRIAIEAVADHGVWWGVAGEGAPDPRLADLGVRAIGPVAPDDPDASAAWRRHRLSLGVTEGAAELGQDATLWLECNAAELHGVSFTKGCYVGQENTARMNWRAKVNRRLVVLPAGQADPARVRVAYPDLGLAVAHLRVDDMADLPLPGWLAAAMDAARSDGAGA